MKPYFEKKPHRVPAIRNLRKWIEKNISDAPCKEFVHGCCACETWLTLHRLEEMWGD